MKDSGQRRDPSKTRQRQSIDSSPKKLWNSHNIITLASALGGNTPSP